MLKKVKGWDNEAAEKSANSTTEVRTRIDKDGNVIQETVEKAFDDLAKQGSMLTDDDLEAMDDKYSHLLSAYQMSGSAKVKGTVEFLENLVENRVKFVVFAHHYEVMDQIEDNIVKKKIPYIRIDG